MKIYTLNEVEYRDGYGPNKRGSYMPKGEYRSLMQASIAGVLIDENTILIIKDRYEENTGRFIHKDKEPEYFL